jgi:hypothetical protein
VRRAKSGACVWLCGGALALKALGGCGSETGDPNAATQPDSSVPSGGASGANPASGSGDAAARGGSGGLAGAGGTAGAMTADPGRPIPSGACRPDGPSADKLGAARTVLYSGPRKLGALSERRGQVFVLDTMAGILRLSEGATELERVTAVPASEFLVADLNVYVFHDDGLWRVGISAVDAIPDPVAVRLGHQVALLRNDGTHLYFADARPRGLYRVPIAGGPLETIASAVDARDQVVQSGFVYFADGADKRVQRVPITGGAPMPVSPVALSEPTAVAVAGDAVYWADDFELVASSSANTTARSSLAIAGLRASGRPARVLRLELAGERLYFSDDGGNLGWTALDGKTCGLIAKGVAGLTSTDIAADGKAAYLSVAAGSVHELWRVSLP